MGPWTTKMAAEGPKMEPPGLQNDRFGVKNDLFQQAANQQFPFLKVCC